MRRVSHDLPGVAGRINRATQQLQLQIEDTSDYWRDEKGRAFLQQHTAEVQPAVSQVLASLAKSVELFEVIAKQLQDPDKPK